MCMLYVVCLASCTLSVTLYLKACVCMSSAHIDCLCDPHTTHLHSTRSTIAIYRPAVAALIHSTLNYGRTFLERNDLRPVLIVFLAFSNWLAASTKAFINRPKTMRYIPKARPFRQKSALQR